MKLAEPGSEVSNLLHGHLSLFPLRSVSTQILGTKGPKLTLNTTSTSRKNGSPTIQTSDNPFPPTLECVLVLPPVPDKDIPSPILDSTTIPIQYPLPEFILPRENLPPGENVPSSCLPFKTSNRCAKNSKYNFGGLTQGYP
jgi:hypothetical protein